MGIAPGLVERTPGLDYWRFSPVHERSANCAACGERKPDNDEPDVPEYCPESRPGRASVYQGSQLPLFDPHTTFVLNPKAWANPEPGKFGSGTYYNDYRQQRRPTENLALGRVFRMTEKTRLTVRMEF